MAGFGEDTFLHRIDLGPMIADMRFTDGDLMRPYGKSADGRVICSARSWLATTIIGGTIGQLSRRSRGGLPASSCISRIILSNEAAQLG